LCVNVAYPLFAGVCLLEEEWGILCMSDRRRAGLRSEAQQRGGVGKKCSECRKYSRNTFYCSKDHKVLDKDREACASFAPRVAHMGKTRKF